MIACVCGGIGEAVLALIIAVVWVTNRGIRALLSGMWPPKIDRHPWT